METVEEKKDSVKEKWDICTLCAEDELTNDAVGYCGKCVKYVCASCLRSHAKFLPDHNLITDLSKVKLRARFCDVHRDETVELYCEEHGCVFCKYCRRLKHKRCCVKTVADAMADRNIEADFASVFESLTLMQEHMEKKRDENQNELHGISKHKGEIKTKLAFLKKGLNEVLETFENSIDDRENTLLETATANMHSYSSFAQQLRTNLSKFRDLEKTEKNRENLFFSAVELNQIYTHYKGLKEDIEDENLDSEVLLVQDKRLPMLIQSLREISDINEPFDISLQKDKQKSVEEKYCQTDTASQDTENTHEKEYAVGASKKSDEGKHSNDQLGDAEHGSSELALEHGVNNIGTKSFLSIKSCQSLAAVSVSTEPSKVCMLQDSRVIYQSGKRLLSILDKDMTTTAELEHPSWNVPFETYISALDIASFDSKRVAILVSGSKKKLPGTKGTEAINVIQLATIIPNVSLDKEIHLRYFCKKVACFDNKLYVYTRDLRKSSYIKCAGVEIIAPNGDVLKTVQLFQDISCFCPDKNGDIVYFGSKKLYGKTVCFIKFISSEDKEVYENLCTEQPKSATLDTEGNVLILDSSGNIAVLKPDGSRVQCLLKRESVDENWQPTTMCYNDINNTILVGGYIYGCSDSVRNKLYLFQLQY